MEDDFEKLKVEYLSNHLLDHTQILNLNLDDQKYFTNSENEDILKILKVENLWNHILYHTQIFNWGLDDQTIFYPSR